MYSTYTGVHVKSMAYLLKCIIFATYFNFQHNGDNHCGGTVLVCTVSLHTLRSAAAARATPINISTLI